MLLVRLRPWRPVLRRMVSESSHRAQPFTLVARLVCEATRFHRPHGPRGWTKPPPVPFSTWGTEHAYTCHRGRRHRRPGSLRSRRPGRRPGGRGSRGGCPGCRPLRVQDRAPRRAGPRHPGRRRHQGQQRDRERRQGHRPRHHGREDHHGERHGHRQLRYPGRRGLSLARQQHRQRRRRLPGPEGGRQHLAGLQVHQGERHHVHLQGLLQGGPALAERPVQEQPRRRRGRSTSPHWPRTASGSSTTRTSPSTSSARRPRRSTRPPNR